MCISSALPGESGRRQRPVRPRRASSPPSISATNWTGSSNREEGSL